MKFPKHVSLSIQHNPHKDSYESVLEYLESNDLFMEDLAEEDLVKCIERDELWSIQWYPITPISFYMVISYSLERCLELAFITEEESNE